VILQPGVVLGSDGYGFEFVEGKHRKVPQVGIVEIANDVEVGANTTIDRARFGKTYIGEGTKIDNLVQIAHNVEIGRHCLIVAQVGIAGSTRIGNYVTVAAQSGISGHLEIGDHVVLAAKSAVLKNLPKAGAYMGVPARPMVMEQKKMALVSRLPKLVKEVQELKKKLEELSPQ
jgi:UDP-3-O-[3-hydroxymyristoyl] glucosamine N-acyltransferase